MSDPLERFFGTGNDIDLLSLKPEFRTKLDAAIDRWQNSTRVAFLPRAIGERLYWYGRADKQAARRELEWLLGHWVGASYSDIERRRGILDLTDPFDIWLETEYPGRVVRFEVWPRRSRASRDSVRGLLGNLVALLDIRPPRPEHSTQRVSELVDDLNFAAAANNQWLTQRILDAIDERRLLDTTNLLFLRVRTLAMLQQWEELASPDLLAQLSRLRLPSGVVDAIGTAAYQVFLRNHDVGAVELLAAASTLPQELNAIMRQNHKSCEPTTLIVQGLVLRDQPSLAARLLKPRAEFHPLVRDLLENISPLTPGTEPERTSSSAQVSTDASEDLLRRLRGALEVNDHAGVLAIVESATDEIDMWMLREAVLAADALQDAESAGRAIRLIERRHGGPVDISWPRRNFESTVASLLLRSSGETPNSWDSWIEFAEADDERASGDFDPSDWAQTSPERLIAALNTIPTATVEPYLGRIYSAHQDSCNVEQRSELAHCMLVHMALSTRLRTESRDVIEWVINDALELSGRDGFKNLLQTVFDLLESHLGASSVGWAVDVFSDIAEAATGTGRQEAAAFGHRFVEMIRPLFESLSLSQFEVLSSSLKTLGSAVPDDLQIKNSQRVGSPPYESLRGKQILIYSLRERPARRAAATLRGLGGGTFVEVSTEQGGTPRLRQVARNADIIVVVTAAAKHAATTFIEDNSGSGPVVYANSVGTSSILQALSDHCERVAVPASLDVWIRTD
ncbi:protein DpdD [Lolliginicoccus suaedae]|uniref:protein DpdD n=1 Tax=Lolliginicoccus suaedae TaxID=2605429 RepID=UPI0011EE4575|nr:protein DpdD [Lolliginicoccus suaedae]